MKRAPMIAAALALGASLLAGPAAAQSPNDDNGHHSFVRQALPFVLGRRAHNSTEVQVLVDLIEMRGREAVLRALMRRPEYYRHWTEALADVMRTQRFGNGDRAACMDAPQRLAGDDGGVAGDDGALAEYVGMHASSQFVAQEFNWYDVTWSSLELDNLIPAYRALLYMRAHKANGTSSDNRERAAEFFYTELLNRNPSCLACHFGDSVQQNEPGWKKQHPLHGTLELDAQVSPELANVAAVFRGDIFVTGDEPAGYGPWGMNPECAELDNPGLTAPADEALEVSFAGLSGTNVSVEDLADALMWGYDSLDATEMPMQEPPSDAASAFVYLLAAQVVNGVWEIVMGEPLTLAHGYARNVHQRELHRFLLEDVFLAGHWSLEDLLVEILLSPEFNRRAPLTSARSTPYEVAPVFNAMLPQGPCDAEPDPAFDGPGGITAPSRDPYGIEPITAATQTYTTTAGAGRDPSALLAAAASPGTMQLGFDASLIVLNPSAAGLVSGCTNGQGEIVRRHRPYDLLEQVSAALGWARPRLFADTEEYPDRDLMLELGQYLGRTRPGTGSADFGGYLSWENAVGRCDAGGKLPSNTTGDWFGHLLGAHASVDAANPENPVRLSELVLAVKDRVLQWPAFGPFEPDDGEGGLLAGVGVVLADAGTPGNSERALLEQFLGVSLGTDAAEVPLLEKKLREVCGIYLTSPQFMMAGLDTGEAHSAPRVKACLPGEPCSYQSICNHPRAGVAGAPLVCHTDHVAEMGGLGSLPPAPVPLPPTPCTTCTTTKTTVRADGTRTAVMVKPVRR